MKDYYTDYGHNFIKIFKDINLPDFVKEAETLEDSALKALPDDAFANKVARKLPICSPAETYVSCAYDIYSGQKDEVVTQILKDAAEFWDISDHVEELRKILSTKTQKVASEESDNTWEVSFTSVNNGNGYSFYTCGNGVDTLIDAFESFSKNAHRLSYPDRVSVAKRFSSQFEKLGADKPYYLMAMSEENIPNTENVIQQIKSRAIRLEDHEKRANLIQLANMLEETEDKNLAGFSKIAEYLDEIDKQNDLARFYGVSLKDAHEAVFDTPIKVAKRMCSTLKLASGEYSVDELSAIHEDIYKLALTKEDFEKYYAGKDPVEILNISEESKLNLAEYI
jgi:hypothetical protein